VLNPLVDGVIREGKFLDTGNLTWRFFTQDFEFLLPAAGYVGPGAAHTFEDFLAANPKERSIIRRHDSLLDELRKAAKSAYGMLCGDRAFFKLAEERLAQFESKQPRREFPGGAISREEFPRLVAERVVNSIVEVLPHFSDAAFWQESRDAFMPFRAGPAFRKLDSVLRSLRKHNDALSEHLKGVRFRFCTKYDLPADPLPYTPLVAEWPSRL
jgi:hypothetical protein